MIETDWQLILTSDAAMDAWASRQAGMSLAPVVRRKTYSVVRECQDIYRDHRMPTDVLYDGRRPVVMRGAYGVIRAKYGVRRAAEKVVLRYLRRIRFTGFSWDDNVVIRNALKRTRYQGHTGAWALERLFVSEGHRIFYIDGIRMHVPDDQMSHIKPMRQVFEKFKTLPTAFDDRPKSRKRRLKPPCQQGTR